MSNGLRLWRSQWHPMRPAVRVCQPEDPAPPNGAEPRQQSPVDKLPVPPIEVCLTSWKTSLALRVGKKAAGAAPQANQLNRIKWHAIVEGARRLDRNIFLGRAPWGLVGMLLFLWVFETIVRDREAIAFSSLAGASWCHAAKAASSDARGASILVFGDSIPKLGISPPVLEVELHEPAYNLAAFGGPPAFSYFMLQRTVELGAKPKTVILSFMPANLAIDLPTYMQFWQKLTSAREAVDLAWTLRDLSFLAELSVGRMFPSVRNRRAIRSELDDALAGQKRPTREPQVTEADWRTWQQNRGGHLVPEGPAPGRSIRADLGDHYLFPTTRSSNPAQASYLQRFLQLAADHQIRVVCFLAPIASRTQEMRERVGLDAHYTQLIRNLKSLHPEVIVLDGRDARYHDDLFMDQVHLNSAGATRLSRELAGVLTRISSGEIALAEWTHLPSYGGMIAERPAGDVRRR
jgi:hypothetical protein